MQGIGQFSYTIAEEEATMKEKCQQDTYHLYLAQSQIIMPCLEEMLHFIPANLLIVMGTEPGIGDKVLTPLGIDFEMGLIVQRQMNRLEPKIRQKLHLI